MAAFDANAFFGRFRVRKGDASRVREEFWPKMKAVAARIPFAEDAVAAYYCTLDATRRCACAVRYWRRLPTS